MPSLPHKSAAFWPLAALLVLADCGTKELAVEHLSPAYTPHDVIGSVVRFTLAYNPNAAFGLSVGPHSRWVITAFAVIVVAVLLRLYHGTPERDAWQAIALGLVMGGAVGNALDRLRSARGVVDFVDVGLGDHRFWTFNVADVGLTIGGLLLALVLWRREVANERGAERGT
jgi:signal peptidase II